MMVVRRAVVVGILVALDLPRVATAQEASASSSTAAFPDTAPKGGSDPSPRAGYPAPATSRQPAPVQNYQQYAQPQYPAQPQYQAQPRWQQQYPGAQPVAPSGTYTAPSAYQAAPGWNGYGAGAQPYGYPLGADRKVEPVEKPTRYVSLTISPVHLALPVFEATLEVRPTPHLGIAVIGGLGDAPPAVVGQNLVDSGDRYSVREIGGQILAYPLGQFDGLVLGAEVLSMKVSGTTTVSTQTIDVTGSALALGPLIGGKWIHESGFTLFGHLGVQRLWLKAEWSAAGQTVAPSDTRWFPLVNLNAGWSF